MAGAEGWRGMGIDEKAGAESKQIEPLTKTGDILGGSDVIWLRFYHNPSDCSVKYRLIHPGRRQWQYFTRETIHREPRL